MNPALVSRSPIASKTGDQHRAILGRAEPVLVPANPRARGRQFAATWARLMPRRLRAGLPFPSAWLVTETIASAILGWVAAASA